MGVRETTTYTLVCDRCGFTERDTERSPMTEDIPDWQHWCRRGVDGVWPITQQLLCGRCARKLDAFMMGTKTPRGVRFNGGEDARY